MRVLLRADSGFGRDALIAWCEQNRVDFVFGLARNACRVEELGPDLALVEEEAASTGKPAQRLRDFRWSTLDSWSRRRRVIGKAEWTRGEMENRIKECQLELFAGRASAATMRANRKRPSSTALRRVALIG